MAARARTDVSPQKRLLKALIWLRMAGRDAFDPLWGNSEV